MQGRPKFVIPAKAGIQIPPVVPRSNLTKGAGEKHSLMVELDDEGKLETVVIDEEETARARKMITEKLERLRRGGAFE